MLRFDQIKQAALSGRTFEDDRPLAVAQVAASTPVAGLPALTRAQASPVTPAWHSPAQQLRPVRARAVLRTVRRGRGVKPWVILIGDEIYDDTMGRPRRWKTKRAAQKIIDLAMRDFYRRHAAGTA